MKRRIAFVLMLVIPLCSFGETKESIENLFSCVDTPDSAEAAFQIGIANIPLIEAILLDKPGRPLSRAAAFGVLRGASLLGRYPTDKFFNLALNQVNGISEYSLPGYAESFKSDIIVSLSMFGTGLSVMTNFSTFSTLTEALLLNGLISDRGLLNSLNQKIANAQSNFGRQIPEAKDSAVNQIEATIKELDAQRGGHVTEMAYQILTGYCRSLISTVQKPD